MKKRILATILFLAFSSSEPVFAVTTEAESCVVINADTREIIYSKNHKTPLGIASTTKIMTAIIATENASGGDLFTVSENAQNQEGSSIYLRKGEKYTLRELLLGLMLNSGNDAAMTIAENIGSSYTDFISLMNEKAKEIGCRNTNFENPSGLPSDNHYSTAYDMALIMAYAMENDLFMEIVSQKEYQLKTDESVTYLRNHNKLLWQYPYCIGGKTGFTKTSGRCLVSASEKDGKRIVCVTLNDRNDWEDHKALSEYAFEKINKVRIVDKFDILTTKKINKTPINLIARDDVDIFLTTKSKRNLVCKLYINEINTNISVGKEIGVAKIFYKDFHIATVPLLSGNEIKKHPTNVFINNTRYILDHTLLNKQKNPAD